MNLGASTATDRPAVPTRWILAAAVLLVSGLAAELEAATVVESAEGLTELCEVGSPEADEDRADPRTYHEERRRAIHRIYEVALPELDHGRLGYDRVSGLLTITGIGTYRPFGGGPSLRFRNETLLKFEFDENRAHDLMAQLRMGTVEVRIGFSLAGRHDYDTVFCSDDESGSSYLDVDLLYARLVDTEREEARGGEVIDVYQTRRGYRWMLRRDMAAMGVSRDRVPDVQVSHLQWRPVGRSWNAGFDDGRPDELEGLTPEIETAIEKTLYPCYVRGLTENPTLQGAVVVEIPTGEARPGSAEFLMDTIQAGGLRRCIRQRLDDVELFDEAGDIGAVEALKATILMRRH